MFSFRNDNRVRGLTLIELMMAIVIVGTTLSPMLGVVNEQNIQGRRNRRLAVSESLVRDEIEYLRWLRFRNGFDWLWGQATGSTNVSGVSNQIPPGVDPINPQIDSKYRATTGNDDPTKDVFDREVQIFQRTQAGVRFIEITVTIYNQTDPALSKRVGVPPFFQVTTYIGDHPSV